MWPVVAVLGQFTQKGLSLTGFSQFIDTKNSTITIGNAANKGILFAVFKRQY